MKKSIIFVGSFITIICLFSIYSVQKEFGYLFGNGLWLPVFLIAFFTFLVIPGFLVIRLMSLPINRKEILILSIASSIGINSLIAILISWISIPVNSKVFIICYFLLLCISFFIKPFRVRFKSIQINYELFLYILSYSSLFLLLIISFNNFVVPASIYDASFHGLLVQQIHETQSVLPSVTNSGLYTPPMDGKFYPFGVHLNAALIMGVTQLPAYKAIFYLTIVLVAFIPISMTMCIESFSTKFIQNRKLLSLISLPLSIVFLFYQPFGWGGFPLLIGLALLPVALAVFYRLLNSDRKLHQWALLLSLILSSSYYIHISEVYTFIFLAGLITIFTFEKIKRLGKRMLLAYLTIGVYFILLIIPTLPFLLNLFHSSGSYMGYFNNTQSITEAILTAGWLSFGKNGFYLGMILFLIGVFYIVKEKPMRILFIKLFIVGLLYLLVSIAPESLIRFISFPYFNQSERILYLLYYFLVIFSAIGLYFLTLWVFKQGRPLKILFVSIISISLLFSFAKIVDNLQSYQKYSVLTLEEMKAFSWLKENVPKEEPILNEMDNGSSWIPSVVGNSTLLNQSQNKGKDYHNRLYVLENIGKFPDDKKLQQLIESYNLTYIFYSNQVIQDGNQYMNIESLENNPHLIKVYENRHNAIFQIKK